jgi:hypothetical protein
MKADGRKEDEDKDLEEDDISEIWQGVNESLD